MQNLKLKFKSFALLLTFILFIFTFNSLDLSSGRRFSLLTFNLEKADSAFSLAVSPSLIQIQAKSPLSIKTPIVIQNPLDQSIDLDIQLKPFKASDKANGEVDFLSKDEKMSGDPFIFEKIGVSENNNKITQTILSPLQKKELLLTIDLPEDQPSSDYYFSIIFSQKTKEEGKKSFSVIKGAIAVNVLLSVNQTSQSKAEIKEFKAPLFLEKGPVPFTVKIKNNSDHFIAPKGEILIKNIFGQTIGKVDLLPVNILSNSSRFIPSPDTSNAPHVIWPESFILGLYTATLKISLSEKGPTLVDTSRFIGMPLQGALGVAIALLIVIIIRRKIRRKLKEL